MTQMRAEAKTKAARAKATKPTPVNVSVDADPTAAILQVAQMMQQSYDAMLSTLALVQEQSAQLSEQLAKMEIRAGDVAVNIPQRADGFRIEYDENGQPERLIPEYTKH